VAYDEALKFDPEDKDVWELKAESLRALGRENEAQKADTHAHPPDA
jgi:Tetratricopeptide repeat